MSTAWEGAEPWQDVFFAPFRLDVANGRLWRGAAEISLRPKAFGVLRHLVEHRGRLISTRELVEAVWAGSHGSEALVKGCVRELRRALGDAASSPRYVETVGRRGYRFVAPAETSSAARAAPDGRAFVGRAVELEELHARLDQALVGTRQIVLISGEPGIGKTTLTERFLEAAEARHELRIARGRCLEHHGPVEPYMPLLEALTRLARGPGGERVVGVLLRYAPSWLVQMAQLLSEEERAALEPRLAGASRARMLREMCEAAEALAAERPLVLWLEDLQWADPSTVDLLASLATRREPARLLVLGTYRPADVVVSRHPLRALTHELGGRGLCHALALGLLSAADVERWLALRFPGHAFPSTLAPTLQDVTDGNPLFIGALLDELMTRGALEQPDGRWRLRGGVDVLAAEPESVRQLVDRHVERLDEGDARLLEAASVAGREFSAGLLASALGFDADEVDARLEVLGAHGYLLVPKGIESTPQRAASGRWAFAHALYRKFIYARIPPSRRLRLHRRLGDAQEAGWGDRAEEIAAELALHFERGHDAERATRYLALAGETAFRRAAYGEAIDLFRRALAALAGRPPSRARDDRELDLQIALGPPLMIVQGYAAPAVARAYRRAAQLCRRVRPSRRVFATLCGLWRFHYTRGDLARAADLAARALHVAGRSAEPDLAPVAHTAIGCTLFYRGAFERARTHLERGLRAGRSRERQRGFLVYRPRNGLTV